MKWVEIPAVFADMPLWGAKSGKYSFVISLDDEEYRASWKSSDADLTPFGKQPANYIEGSPFGSFNEATHACEATLKQLLRKQ